MLHVFCLFNCTPRRIIFSKCQNCVFLYKFVQFEPDKYFGGLVKMKLIIDILWWFFTTVSAKPFFIQPTWSKPIMSVAISAQSNDMDNQVEIHHLYTIVIILVITLVVLIALFVVVLRLYRKNKISNSLLFQKNNEIEAQRKSNERITETLEQQKKAIEQQERELQDTTTELRWQTENALRLYDEVEQQKEEITSSIMYASRIQTALLPETTLTNEILNDYFVLFRPRDIVSGDFYWVSAKDNKTILVVADCTGH